MAGNSYNVDAERTHADRASCRHDAFSVDFDDAEQLPYNNGNEYDVIRGGNMALLKNFDMDEFRQLIDDVYDEICIWDASWHLIYANKVFYRHYNIKPEELIGKTVEELSLKRKLWYPTCVPETFTEKKPFIQRQRTITGIDITTISVPVFDDNDNVRYIVQSVREGEKELNKELTPIKPQSDEDEVHERRVIYKSREMGKTLEYAETIAKTDAPILILGETGTGKSYIAKYIHEHSSRRDKPFVVVNMASLSPSVIESELFGYKRGAFTGADSKGKKGLFEAANGGTLFLDEMGDFPYELQSKLLNVIQEEEFIPVGGTETVKLNVRLICATNCDLVKMIEAGKFRRDLYHRINMLEITIPPLRRRKDDITVLTDYFLSMFNRKYGKHVVLSESVRDIFMKYSWTGNVRELSNVVERGVITSEHDIMDNSCLPDSFFSMDNIKTTGECVFERMSYDDVMEEYEGKIIRKAYEMYPSSRRMAEALKISQSTANRLIRKYIEKT